VINDGSPTLSRLLVTSIRRHGDRPAVRHEGRVVTYRELDELSDRLATSLTARGLVRGDRVALHLRNCIEYAVADLAILKAALVKVPLNEFMAEREVAYCLQHAGARALISHSSMPRQVREVLDELVVHIVVPDGTDGAANQPRSLAWEEAIRTPCAPVALQSEPSDSAIVMYTGGTTGQAKGVHHLQGRMALNLLAHVICGDIRSDEVMLLNTPLPHSAGFMLQACLLQGGIVVLGPKFDAKVFLEFAAAVEATWTFAVPTMIYRVLDAVAAGTRPLPALRTVVYGAAPMDPVQLKRALSIFGPVFLQLYGQTECPNFITSLTKADHLVDELHASCGRAVPFVEVRLCDSQGAIVLPDQVGELEVRSPYQLSEYYADPVTTALSIVDGWLRTGDLGYQNEQGYVFLVDRVKDMIITGGLNVYSIEVEVALRANPAVGEVGVVGVPDRDWGEAVIAVVVAREPVSAESLTKFARERLSAYKVPKRIVFVSALPLTRYGKPDKKALRTMLQTQA